MLLIFMIGCASTVVEQVEAPKDAEIPEVQTAVPVQEDPVIEEEIIISQTVEKELEELLSKTYLTKDGGVYKNYILRLEGVSEKICGINVDGSTYWIEEGDSQTISTLTIYVKEVIVSNSFGGVGDFCEITLHKY